MSYMRHHAMIVTTFTPEYAQKAHGVAVEIFGERVTPIITDNVNAYKTFFIVPDGSKEGWDASEIGDMQRDRFIEWLDSTRHEDGSCSYSWVEVQYGDDEKKTLVVGNNREVGTSPGDSLFSGLFRGCE